MAGPVSIIAGVPSLVGPAPQTGPTYQTPQDGQIEALEEQVTALTTKSQSPLAWTGSTVASIAALLTLRGADGDTAFVQSVRAQWRYLALGSSLMIDHITVEATADGGNTRWVRQDSVEPYWSSFGFVYLDGTNGDDENQGFYTTAQATLAAIKTWAEMFRRLGEEWAPMVNTTVTVLNTYPSDALHFMVHFHAALAINFVAPALTQASSGVFSAVANSNHSSTNKSYLVTDGIVTTSADVTRRIRITSGARAGPHTWVATSPAAGERTTGEARLQKIGFS